MTIIEELAATKADLDAKVLALANAEAAMKAAVDLAGQAKKELDDVKAAMAAMESAKAEELAKLDGAVKAEAVAHEGTKQKLEKAEKALANPAFAAAAAVGSSVAVPVGGAEATSVMTREQALAEYKKIEDPAARAQFRADHAAELKLK
jgi:hypothetical protein